MLGLDESIKPAVHKMRRNLLKLLNVGEFDACAEWQDPCISFTLPEVYGGVLRICRVEGPLHFLHTARGMWGV